MTTTGAYRQLAATASSQTKLAAPTVAACLLNKFQLAWAIAATSTRARAAVLTGLPLR
jgi:hypothetical protein